MTITQVTRESDMVANQEVLLSIITVVRNDAQRLEKTIDSLFKFYGDERFEHVVIDGKSSDRTLDLLQKNSQHKNFQYLSEPDNGIYDGMNKGSGLASGRFLLFLNCGDRMATSPDQIDELLRPVAQADEADIVCFCSMLNHKAHVSVLRPQSGRRHKMPTSHQAMVFSKKFMRTHLYDTRYRIAADFNLYLSANAERVLVFTGSEPLTDIEAVGVASENPWQSYKEYLQIAAEKLHGSTKWFVLARIGCKAVAVILLKKTLPKAWLDALGRYA
jgi:putative colanic acid biosynthesis glycosyltransferase